MAKQKPGQRHQLLLLRNSWDRLWLSMLGIGLLLAGLWVGLAILVPSIDPLYDTLLFVGAAVILAFAFLTFVVRGRSYVQPFVDHVRLVTPLLQIKISYRRIRSVHSAELQDIFPPREVGAFVRDLLDPFYGRSAVLLDLNGYPVSLGLLRMLLPRPMLAPKGTGFVLVVKDWMALSTELDSFNDNYRMSRGTRSPSVGYGMYQKPKR